MGALTIKIFRIIFGLFVLSSLMACGKGTPEKAEAWFVANEIKILEMNQLLLNHPAIKRVDPGLRTKFAEGYKKFSIEDKQVYAKLKESCESLGIINIQNARVNSEDNGKLITISYLLERSGYAFSGGTALTVEYIPDTYFLTRQQQRGSTVKPLHTEDWYVLYREWK